MEVNAEIHQEVFSVFVLQEPSLIPEISCAKILTNAGNLAPKLALTGNVSTLMDPINVSVTLAQSSITLEGFV